MFPLRGSQRESQKGLSAPWLYVNTFFKIIQIVLRLAAPRPSLLMGMGYFNGSLFFRSKRVKGRQQRKMSNRGKQYGLIIFHEDYAAARSR